MSSAEEQSKIESSVTAARFSVLGTFLFGGVMALLFIGFSAGFIIAAEEDTDSICSPWLLSYGIILAIVGGLELIILLACQATYAAYLLTPTDEKQPQAAAAAITLGSQCPMYLWTAANAVFFIAFIALLVQDECIQVQKDWSIVGVLFGVILCGVACVLVCFGACCVATVTTKKSNE
jgi:hypothetical protein